MKNRLTCSTLIISIHLIIGGCFDHRLYIFLLLGERGLYRTWVSWDKRIINSKVHFKILEKLVKVQNNISDPGTKFDKSTLIIF